MNETIKELQAKLGSLQANVSDVEAKLQEAWNGVFEDLTVVKEAIAKLMDSKDYSMDDLGEVCSWLRFDLSQFADCKDYFQTYMRDQHSIGVDWSTDSLSYSNGPSIVINEDGDVQDQDSGKWFLSKDHYRDERGDVDTYLRDQLIEEYMSKCGWYPGVFEVDHYGNVSQVKTNRVVKPKEG